MIGGKMVNAMTAPTRSALCSGKNATVLPLSEYRGGARRNLNISRVRNSTSFWPLQPQRHPRDWRDYAIDHRDGQALFSIFRHTHESALYTSSVGGGKCGVAQFNGV